MNHFHLCSSKLNRVACNQLHLGAFRSGDHQHGVRGASCCA